MKWLTVDRHPIGIRGVWRIRQGAAYLATLVQPNVIADMGIPPTAAEVREAVRALAPGYGVTDQTPITITERAEDV